MIAVVQRVKYSSVEINGNKVSEIKDGILIFLGIKKGDTKILADYLSNKAVNLRIFSDENEKMNLSVRDVDGEIMVISQFTLCNNKNKSGNRPSFTLAEEPEKAKMLYEYFIDKLKEEYKPDKVSSGIFSAYMKINILNDGPVTILLEKEK